MTWEDFPWATPQGNDARDATASHVYDLFRYILHHPRADGNKPNAPDCLQGDDYKWLRDACSRAAETLAQAIANDCEFPMDNGI